MIKKGVISVYLSLTFMIIVSMLLVFLESARCYVIETMGERYADMAAEMVFASYVRPLAERYDILVFDGGENHRESQLFREYLTLNLEMNSDNERLFDLYAQVNDGSAVHTVSIKDDEWKSFIDQIERYEKYSLGEQGIDKIKNIISQTDNNQIVKDAKDYSNELAKKEQEAYRESEKSEDDGEEKPEKFDDSVEDPRPGIGKWLKTGLLNIIMSDQKISENIMDVSACSWQTGTSRGEEILNRFEKSEDIAAAVKKTDWLESLGQGILNQGSNLSMNAYIMEKFHHLNSEISEANKQETVLDYEIEYILYGQNSDRENLEKCMNSIFLLRTILNLIYLYTSPQKEAITQNTVELMNILGQISVIGQVVKLLLMACWAAAESVVDCAALADGKKVPLVKDDHSWNLTMQQLMSISKAGGKASSYVKDGSRGMNYGEYLFLILFTISQESRIIRMTQLMESNVRLEKGYEEFSFINSITGADFSGEFSIGNRFWHFPEAIQYSFNIQYSY